MENGYSKMVRLLILVALIGSGSLALSSASFGAGSLGCDRWSQARGGSDWFHLGQWVLGFANSSMGDEPGHRRPLELFDFVDGHCAGNPDDQLATAAAYLVDELTVQRR